MKRETSTYERILYYHGQIGPMYYAFYLKLNTLVKITDFKSALAKARKKHPVTGIRVEITEDKKQFITTENVPEIPVEVYSSTNMKWYDLITVDLKNPFDIYKGPLLRFFLIENKDFTEIIPVFHHGICDGVAAILFLHDVLMFLENPDLPVIENDESITLLKALKKEIIDDFNNKPIPDYIKEIHNKEINPELAYKKKEFPDPDFNLHCWYMDEGEFERLHNFTKTNFISLNSIFAAGFLKVFADLCGKKTGYKRIVQCPVNFRIYLKEEADLYAGLFNGLIKSEIDCNPERSIIDIAKDVNKDIKEKLRNYDVLTSYLNFEKFFLQGVEDPELLFSALDESKEYNYDFSLSNLGKIQLKKKYGNYIIEEFYGPMFSAVHGERVIGISTHGNKIYFNLVYDRKCFDKELASKIIDRTREIFDNIINNPLPV